MRLGAQAPRLAVGLTRVSTAEQGQSGLGLEAQQASIRSFVAMQGWTLVAEHSDVASGKDDRRPGFQAALARCRQLDAVLVAARLDRITRRAHTLSQLLEDGVSIRAADMRPRQPGPSWMPCAGWRCGRWHRADSPAGTEVPQRRHRCQRAGRAETPPVTLPGALSAHWRLLSTSSVAVRTAHHRPGCRPGIEADRPQADIGDA